MAQIKIDLAGRLIDGMTVKFKAPCDCTEVTGLLVSYVGDTGAAASKSFTFRDCHNNDLAGLGNLFGEGAYVVAILDAYRGYAYLQNADTNAYLEQGAANFPDRSIDRSKLANNALYGVVQTITTTDNTFTTADAGKLFVTNDYASATNFDTKDFVFRLTKDVSAAMPAGAEIMIMHLYAKSVKIITNGVRLGVPGESTHAGGNDASVAVTLKLTEKFGVLALKRLFSSGAGDMWMIQGMAEVEK